MTSHATRRTLTGSFTFLTVCALAMTATAQTSTVTTTRGAATTTTQVERATVRYVEGNTVVLEMTNGDIRTVNVDPNRTATIDGKTATVRDLKAGTQLTATYTTTSTPITERTVTVASGTVWYVAGSSVIATIDGQNKQFTPAPGQVFTVDGQQLDIFALKKGMRFSAQKIVEAPTRVVALNTTITGTTMAVPGAMASSAPAAGATAAGRAGGGAGASSTAGAAGAQTSASGSTSAAAPARPSGSAAASSQGAAGAGAGSGSSSQQGAAMLPKTASPLPLAGLLGLLFVAAGFGLRTLRRS